MTPHTQARALLLSAMSKPEIVFLAQQHDYQFGWSRRIRYNGTDFMVGIEQGKLTRIAYKPRGPGAYGHHWIGFVRDAKGHSLWSGRVSKSVGCAGLIRFAAEDGKI